MRRSENGNVLFLIMIAVALFAALSYAVTSSTRTSPASVSKEQAQLIASDLMQYASLMTSGIMRMRASGFQVWELDFVKATPNDGADSNTSCKSDACALFSPQGGGVIYRTTYVDPDFAYSAGGSGGFYFAGVKNVGGADPELIWFKGGLTKEICQYINYKSDVYTI